MTVGVMVAVLPPRARTSKMATTNDSGGLVDRRSLRELKETGVGGKRAPRNARKQLANSRRRKALEDREAKRLRDRHTAQTTDTNNE